MKISAAKLRKLKDGLKKLHEETTGCGKESAGYFGVALQHQQQVSFPMQSSRNTDHFMDGTRIIFSDRHLGIPGDVHPNQWTGAAFPRGGHPLHPRELRHPGKSRGIHYGKVCMVQR